MWGCRQLWIIENKVYDLDEFAKRHSGGQHWIKMTQGQDITTLFRIHHLNYEKVSAMLPKYEVGDCPIKNEQRFDFTSSGYYDELRKRILSEYSVEELQNC